LGPGPGQGAPSGSALPGPSVPPPAPPSAPPPAPPPAPVEPLTFEWAQIRLDSKPPGADVKDLTNGTLIGHTPFTFKVRPSRNARQFALRRKDYVDAVVELVPDRQTIDVTEKLVRTPSGSAAVRPGPDPRRPPPPTGSAAARPAATVHTSEPAVPVKPEPPVPAGSAAGKPKPADDDCEPPCLKADPSRPGGAEGSAR
jgi:hypothetical protein